MEKNEVWENIKKYAKVFFQGVGLFFAYCLSLHCGICKVCL